MHPEQIKAAIRMRGTTPTAIADELGVSRSMVSHVINGHAKSERIARRIAEVIEEAVETIWPTSQTSSRGLRRARTNAAGSARTPA